MKQFHGIELFRGMCLLSALLWHYQHFLFFGTADGVVTSQVLASFPFYRLLKPVYGFGSFSVQVFWTISGFIFFWKYAGRIHSRGISARTFILLRFSRLYPLHFVTLILVLCLQSLYMRSHESAFIYQPNDALHFVLHLFFVSNWLGHVPYTFNGPVWSVSVELLAFIVFFVTLLFFSPSLVLCGSAVAVTVLLFSVHPDRILSCLMFFFSGGFIERCIHRLDRRGQMLCFWTSGFAVLAIFLLCDVGESLSMTMKFTLSAAFVFCFALIEKALPISLSSVGWVGNLTYASYLVHFPVQLLAVIIVDSLGYQRAVFFNREPMLIFILTTFALGFVIYRYFEVPAQTMLRHRLIGERARAPDLAGRIALKLG